jgi:hypothetical protein
MGMTISVLRKRLNAMGGLLLLAGLGYAVWPFIFGRTEMQNFCAVLPVGTSLSQVQALAAAKGYRVSSLIDGEAFVHDPRSMGRFNCELHLGSTGLVSSPYADNP